MPTKNPRKRASISPLQRIEIWKEYQAGGCSVRSLAKRYGCSKSFIAALVKEEEPVLPVAPPDPPEVKKSLQRAKKKKKKGGAEEFHDFEGQKFEAKPRYTDPLQFREQKLEEIALDIQNSRLSGRTSIIPQLHRLHLSVHDEVSSLRESMESVEDGLDQAAMIAIVVGTISKLPPMTRQTIQDQIEDLETGRVISFPQVETDETG